ncbi:two-component regulator propeller domain-containing protein [Chitinophaga sp. MM2321]|uniref:hybrid sensor histidine kinase/response regulator transcription factor n=1 Tax=Chitinophaga sp. MM2321 TaxID=3137178 RepID=UPI0032D5AB61
MPPISIYTIYKYVLTFLVCIFPPFCIYGQELLFSRLTSEDGLSPGAVLAIAQDQNGFMWFGTQNGLNRFDTRRFKLYKHPQLDPDDIFTDYITRLLSDSDKTLWVGTRNGLSKYNPETDRLERIPLKTAPYENNLNISCIYEDRQKTVWVWSSAGLFRLVDRKAGLFKQIAVPGTVAGLAANNTRTIYQDHRGVYWIGSSAGLTQMEYTNGKFTYKSFSHKGEDPFSLSDNYITAIVEDNLNRLWIGTQQGGLNLYDSATQTFRHFSAKTEKGLASNNIREIKTDPAGKLWIGTQGGISIYDPATGLFETYRSVPENMQSLSHNSIHSIYLDKQATVWIGTYWGGVNSVSTDNTPFHVYKTSLSRPSINNNVVSAVLEDKAHNLWVGTEGGGLNYIDRKKHKITTFQYNPADKTSLGSNLVKVIYSDTDGNIWVGTHGGGLNLLAPSGKTFTRFLYQETDPAVRNTEVLYLLEDKDGIFWIGTQTGLLAFRRYKTSLQYLPESSLTTAIGKASVKSILQTRNGDLWIGSSNGLYMLKKSTGIVDQFTTADGLPKNDINCLYEDKNNNIWVGCSFAGLALYAPGSESKKFTVYQKKDGMPDENIASILGDDNDNLWISTGNGLSKLHVKNGVFKNYNKGDGLAGNTFTINSCYKSAGGDLFFGGYNGLTFFSPDRIGENSVAPATFLTSLKLFNNTVQINEDARLLSREISLTRDIRFTHRQNVFTLEFAALNYVRPDKNTYAYKLDGFDDSWSYTATPSATYMNLPPGDYLFLAKGANNDGVWGAPCRLAITVLPPFWKTIWAYILYVICLAAIIFFVIRFFVLRSLIKRDRELTRLKLDFFTNITHEMRTRLSLILGPAEKLLLINKEDDEHTKQIQIIRKNSEGLLHLLTELMDFRKAETGNLTLKISEENIVPFIQEVFGFFNHLAVSMNIKSDFTASNQDIRVYYDRLQLEKVFFNLIFNAYKFTPPGCKIAVTVEEKEETVVVTVVDNGKGVAPENISRLFTNYFQEDDQESDNKGYGIGLALAKSITELHRGTIGVESVQNAANGNLTTFTVTLLKGNGHFAGELVRETLPSLISYNGGEGNTRIHLPQQPEIVHGIELDTSSKEKSTILLIEDNAVILSLNRDFLEKDYTIITRADGLSGWEAAIENIPDIIISDVMMPGLDGYTLCRRLKTDERTSHIPVILLTAMSSPAQQVSGLEKGADVYLTKPFSIQVLQLHICNLLHLREKIRGWLGQQLLSPNLAHDVKPGLNDSGVVGEEIIVDAFLEKVISIIEENIDDSSFNVDILSRKLAMSRPILYKKMNALAGLSVNDFIKAIRMKKAMEYLAKDVYTISEIAYMVGFSDPKYFSREFKKKFGKSPREWRETDKSWSITDRSRHR